jgi:hypothetical protein
MDRLEVFVQYVQGRVWQLTDEFNLKLIMMYHMDKALYTSKVIWISAIY